MSIYLYILVFIGIMVLGWVIVFIFDYFLCKGVFQLIVGKAKQKLDKEKLKDAFQKIMESLDRKSVV